MEELAVHPVILVPADMPEAFRTDRNPTVTPSGAPVPRGPRAASFTETLTLIAFGRGVFPVGDSVARLYPRPDVVYLPFTDAPPVRWGPMWLKPPTVSVNSSRRHTMPAISIDSSLTQPRLLSVRDTALTSRGPTASCPRTTDADVPGAFASTGRTRPHAANGERWRRRRWRAERRRSDGADQRRACAPDSTTIPGPCEGGPGLHDSCHHRPLTCGFGGQGTVVVTRPAALPVTGSAECTAVVTGSSAPSAASELSPPDSLGA
ncbi:hypothetical protein ACFV8T_38465 [Streptomyces sp. NPDC059832]|uniref:hypothetical protein n=1 Tax=Streptomyces sp. NPDC059832 TaxID=3346966 RepID=UPI00365DA134